VNNIRGKPETEEEQETGAHFTHPRALPNALAMSRRRSDGRDK
jgi:hypothetical protein